MKFLGIWDLKKAIWQVVALGKPLKRFNNLLFQNIHTKNYSQKSSVLHKSMQTLMFL